MRVEGGGRRENGSVQIEAWAGPFPSLVGRFGSSRRIQMVSNGRAQKARSTTAPPGTPPRVLNLACFCSVPWPHTSTVEIARQEVKRYDSFVDLILSSPHNERLFACFGFIRCVSCPLAPPGPGSSCCRPASCIEAPAPASLIWSGHLSIYAVLEQGRPCARYRFDFFTGSREPGLLQDLSSPSSFVPIVRRFLPPPPGVSCRVHFKVIASYKDGPEDTASHLRGTNESKTSTFRA